jgi:DNA-binding beta-propeller fold protein YncE
MRLNRVVLSALMFVFVAGVSLAFAQSDWAVVKTFHIGGEGSWDYLTVDSHTRRLFVPRTTHTMVIDADSGKVLADIPGQKNAHGVAIAPAAGRGFISDGGGTGQVVVFDLKTYAILGRIVTVPDSDGIIFDPISGLVLLDSGDKGVLISFRPDIDLEKGKFEAPIELGGAPEFLAADENGRIYVNLMDKNAVAVVDLKARRVVARWPVVPGGAPVGMSIDRKNRRLIIGCRNPQKLIVMSTENGKVISNLPIGETVDATKLDGDELLASCRDGTLAVASQRSGKYQIVQTVKTLRGASTMGLDPQEHRIYLPTAEFEPSKTDAKGRPIIKPGTFMVLVVGHRPAR